MGQIQCLSNTKEFPVSYLALGQLAHAPTSIFTLFLGNSPRSLCFQLKCSYLAHLAISIFMISFYLDWLRTGFLMSFSCVLRFLFLTVICSITIICFTRSCFSFPLTLLHLFHSAQSFEVQATWVLLFLTYSFPKMTLFSSSGSITERTKITDRQEGTLVSLDIFYFCWHMCFIFLKNKIILDYPR